MKQRLMCLKILYLLSSCLAWVLMTFRELLLILITGSMPHHLVLAQIPPVTSVCADCGVRSADTYYLLRLRCVCRPEGHPPVVPRAQLTAAHPHGGLYHLHAVLGAGRGVRLVPCGGPHAQPPAARTRLCLASGAASGGHRAGAGASGWDRGAAGLPACLPHMHGTGQHGRGHRDPLCFRHVDRAPGTVRQLPWLTSYLTECHQRPCYERFHVGVALTNVCVLVV